MKNLCHCSYTAQEYAVNKLKDPHSILGPNNSLSLILVPPSIVSNYQNLEPVPPKDNVSKWWPPKSEKKLFQSQNCS